MTEQLKWGVRYSVGDEVELEGGERGKVIKIERRVKSRNAPKGTYMWYTIALRDGRVVGRQGYRMRPSI